MTRSMFISRTHPIYHKLTARLLGLLLLFTASAVSGQPPALAAGQPAAVPEVAELTGDDAKRAKQADEQIEKAIKADRWDEAIARAEELLALRSRAQGPKHFETVTTDWRRRTLRLVAQMPKEDRVAYHSAQSLNEQAETLFAQGKNTAAQPLFERRSRFAGGCLATTTPRPPCATPT